MSNFRNFTKKIFMEILRGQQKVGPIRIRYEYCQNKQFERWLYSIGWLDPVFVIISAPFFCAYVFFTLYICNFIYIFFGSSPKNSWGWKQIIENLGPIFLFIGTNFHKTIEKNFQFWKNNLKENVQFWRKSSILKKKFDFEENFLFWRIISVLKKKFDFEEKFQFWRKISFFEKKIVSYIQLVRSSFCNYLSSIFVHMYFYYM